MVLVLFWSLYGLAIILSTRWTVYLFFLSIAFGSLNTIGGSTTITPYAACAPLLVAKVLIGSSDRSTLIDAVFNWRRLGILTAFLFIAIFVTITAPILFRGVPIMGLNTIIITPLHPSAGNVTQSIYLITSYCICVSIYLLMLQDSGRATLAQGMMLGGGMLVFAGMADLATTGTAILAPLRTATYAMLADVDINEGVHRVIGFNTEASAYGTLVLGMGTLLLFVRPARKLGGWWARLELPLAFLLLIFTALSTSSAAYGGLGALIILGLFDIGLRLATASSLQSRKEVSVALTALILLGLAVGLFLLARPDFVRSAWTVFDSVILQKSGSQSYEERGSWTRVSAQALFATGGFGVGAGSTRASNWPVAVASCTGVFGAALLLAFILRIFLMRLPAGDEQIRRMGIGSRYMMLICLVPSIGAGTSVDFGLSNAIAFALMAAVPVVLTPPAWRREIDRPARKNRPPLPDRQLGWRS